VPRPLRVQASNAIYHVTSRGNRRQAIFLDPDDHRFHVWCMNRIALESEWDVFGYVQMTNHFHLLVRTRQANISSGMQRLNGLYAQVFNIRHGYSGHLFQGRFSSEVIESESHLLECLRYDDLNPVRAGLVDHPLEWRWGSCRAVMGLVSNPDFLSLELLKRFGRGLQEARQRYLAFVEERLWSDDRVLRGLTPDVAGSAEPVGARVALG
jgi:putative transposase